jgi:outer membrane receptor for ferrienterochelin and colicins
VYEFLLYLYLLRAPHVTARAESEPTYEEEVIVTATRSGRRVEDQPLRVEVVPAEEVQEKIMMTPGDVSMLLNETNGLRVQITSPSLGGANVRIQGLRGRYTQILSDGLPLYGGQTGSLSLLQIPPMDLGQVEVIKGVASALYGASAVGGVINLVSRRPRDEPERELLLNRTSHAGTDAILWLSQKLNARWGYTLLGGAHGQERSDLDRDGWTDLPFYRRAIAKPRLFWEDGAGRSVLVALGATAEERSGGTMPGAAAPDGRPFSEQLDTTRFDGGGAGRFVTHRGHVLALRGSATWQNHRHTFGPTIERDEHRTWFGEASVTGTTAGHGWVLGGAIQHDAYASRDLPRFDFAYTAPGVFAQDEFNVTRWLTLSASGRIDVHSEYGTFVSPRVSALLKARGGWTGRISAGRGSFAPTPFTEETEATGLFVVAPLGDLEAERADSFSADLTWARSPLEITSTVFYSRVHSPLQVRSADAADRPVVIVNADAPTRTRGTELIARLHRDEPELDVILTHMYLLSSEEDPDRPGVRREVPLNPRHAGSLDVLSELGPLRVGFEVFFTGRQALDDNPYRERGGAYVLWGALLDWDFGRGRAFVNAENLSDIRQTSAEPLVRRIRAPDGRWTVDAWKPLEGRTVNAGIRLRF